jgi:hypothetical protein
MQPSRAGRPSCGNLGVFFVGVYRDVRVSLNPREMVHIDSADNESVKSLNLQCGKNAEKFTIIDTDSLVASGNTIQPPSQPIKASASGF